MNTQAQWVGIDVSQSHLDVALHPLHLSFCFTNNEAGRAQLIQEISGHEIVGIALEATGELERSVMSALENAGYPTRRVNPLQVRHFAKAAGKLAKTDRIDAGMIAHFGESLNPLITLLPDAATREMQALVARRQQVVTMLTMEKNHLHSCESWVRENVSHTIELLKLNLRPSKHDW